MDPERLRYGIRRYLSVKSAYGARFSPDGRRIAYVTDVTGIPQAWGLELDGSGGPQQLTSEDDRVGHVSYSRRHETMAYSLDEGGNERFQIMLLEKGGGFRRALTRNRNAIHNWGGWSHDGRSVSYSSNERHPAFFDIYVHGIDEEQPRMVYRQDGSNYPVRWSPRDDSLLFVRMDGNFDHQLYRLGVADGRAELMTPHTGEAVYSSATFDPLSDGIYCVTDQGREFSGIARIDAATKELSWVHTEGWDVDELSLSDDGERMAFTVNEDGRSRVMILNPRSGSTLKVATPRPGVASGLCWSPDGSSLAFTFSSSSSNADVWIYDVEGVSLRRVTRSSTCGIPEESFVEPRSIRYRSFDGLDIQAYLYVPRTAATGARDRFPLVVNLHGGPEGQSRAGFSPLTQFLLSLGIGVVAPNFRGSTGYGRTFLHLDDVMRRMDTVKDVERLVAHLKENTAVDPSKIAAYGGSYGGFMVLACLYSYPEIWAAGIDVVGIANFITFLKNTGEWRRKLRVVEYGDPERDGDFLRSISPVNNAEKITAPLFVMHGANDPRVPLDEAEQMVDVLKGLGRDVQLMKFEDEGHGLVRLENRVSGYTAAVEFLLKRLGAVA